MTIPLSLFDDLAPPVPSTEGSVRVRLTVAYDGTRFHGFAENPGVATVAGSLRAAIERIVRHPIELTCAGRTDRGVHAHGQVIDFATRDGIDLEALVRGVNALCGPEVAVRSPLIVPMEFSSRFDARSRRYRYTVLNSEIPDPFAVGTAWQVKEPLSLPLLRLGCDPLIGTHDFSSFCRRPKREDGEAASLVRDVHSAEWVDEGDGVLRFWIEASSFCHQMVRSLVGSLVEVGRGRVRAGELHGILEARDRARAGPVAPPQGLSLWRVSYDS